MEEKEQKLTDRQIVENYVRDPENKKINLKIAETLSKIFKSNWFIAEDIKNKTNLKDEKEIYQILLNLQLFKLCVSKEGGKFYKYKTKFKITIEGEDRLKVLYDYKKNYEMQIELIDKEIEEIKNESSIREESEKK